MINRDEYIEGYRPCAVCKKEEMCSELYHIAGYNLCPICTQRYAERIKTLPPLTNLGRNQVIASMQTDYYKEDR
jgi:hypothetical protein